MTNLKEWQQQLHELDTPQNHKKTLKRLLKTYLTSSAADDTNHRTDVIHLFAHISKLLK